MNYLLTPEEEEQLNDDAPPAPGAPAAQPPAPPAADQSPASEPAPVDTSSSWLDEDDDLLGDLPSNPPASTSTGTTVPTQTTTAAPPRPQPQAAPAPAPAPTDQGGLTVTAPHLEPLHPGVQIVGQVPDQISSLVLDVEVPVEVAFGNASLTVEQFLELGAGSVVELDRAISEPVELKVRGRVVARGQLVGIGGRYGLRIVEMVKDR